MKAFEWRQHVHVEASDSTYTWKLYVTKDGLIGGTSQIGIGYHRSSIMLMGEPL